MKKAASTDDVEAASILCAWGAPFGRSIFIGRPAASMAEQR
jgi:hypothetical protein